MKNKGRISRDFAFGLKAEARLGDFCSRGVMGKEARGNGLEGVTVKEWRQ